MRSITVLTDEKHKARKRKNQAEYIKRLKEEGRVRIEFWVLKQHKDYLQRTIKQSIKDLEKI